LRRELKEMVDLRTSCGRCAHRARTRRTGRYTLWS